VFFRLCLHFFYSIVCTARTDKKRWKITKQLKAASSGIRSGGCRAGRRRSAGEQADWRQEKPMAAASSSLPAVAHNSLRWRCGGLPRRQRATSPSGGGGWPPWSYGGGGTSCRGRRQQRFPVAGEAAAVSGSTLWFHSRSLSQSCLIWGSTRAYIIQYRGAY
jgi:hypothetical protein